MRVIGALTVLQETSLDGELIDTKRQTTIQQAKDLSACLFEIHAPYSGVLDDPELNLTKEQIAAPTADATRAEGNLEQRISAVQKSGAELDAAFKASLERLRDRIRQIDVLVADDRPLQNVEVFQGRFSSTLRRQFSKTDIIRFVRVDHR